MSKAWNPNTSKVTMDSNQRGYRKGNTSCSLEQRCCSQAIRSPAVGLAFKLQNKKRGKSCWKAPSKISSSLPASHPPCSLCWLSSRPAVPCSKPGLPRWSKASRGWASALWSSHNREDILSSGTCHTGLAQPPGEQSQRAMWGRQERGSNGEEATGQSSQQPPTGVGRSERRPCPQTGCSGHQIPRGAFQKGNPAFPAGFNWLTTGSAYNATCSSPLISWQFLRNWPVSATFWQFEQKLGR